jgi:hypothetical protein
VLESTGFCSSLCGQRRVIREVRHKDSRGKGRGNERGVAGKLKGVEEAVATLGKRGKADGIAVQRGDGFREE